MSEMCGTRLAENAGPKKWPKIVIWAPSHRFVRLYLRAILSTIGKKNLKQQYLIHMSSQYGEHRRYIGPLTAEVRPVVWGTPANFNGFRVWAALLHGIQVVSVSQTLRR